MGGRPYRERMDSSGVRLTANVYNYDGDATVDVECSACDATLYSSPENESCPLPDVLAAVAAHDCPGPTPATCWVCERTSCTANAARPCDAA